MATTFTVGMADAKTNFSRITANVNRTGIPVTVFKNNKPWVEIRPLAEGAGGALPKETREAIDEVKGMKVDSSHERFATAEDLFEALGI